MSKYDTNKGVMNMITIEQIKEYTKCPQFGDMTYGKWGALTLEQRLAYRRLIDIIDDLRRCLEIEKLKNKSLLNSDYGIKTSQLIKDKKIEIDIYSVFKVMKSVSSSVLSEDNQTIYDNMFVKDENSNIFLINGAKLLEEFSYHLKDDYLQDFVIRDNKITFSIFNYNTGESSDISYTIISREAKVRESLDV